MEAFKIEHYERENGVGTFVPFRHLSTHEANSIFQSLKRRLELPEEFDGLQVVRIISKRGVFIKDFDADQDDFDLKQVMNHINLFVEDKLFVNWYRYDNIDEFRANDLYEKFSDIWYPSSDDIDVFDSSLSWILSISHHGKVQVIRLSDLEAQ
jgi:hypothetical protein